MLGSGWVSKGMWAGSIAPAVSTALSAAGSTIADATQLRADVAMLGTVAASQGVILPPITDPQHTVAIYNGGANAVKVYGTGVTINGIAGATGVSIPTLKSALFLAASGGSWVAVISA